MGSPKIHDYGAFSVRALDITDGAGQTTTYHTLSCPDWVNVIAFTTENYLALVKQYRHGIADYTIEFPGGIADQNCPLLDEAKHELLEETGLGSTHWTLGGRYRPNPALQDNWCHTFVCHSASSASTLPETGCELILANPSAFRAKWKPILMQNSLMATSMLHALDINDDAHAGLCRLFFG